MKINEQREIYNLKEAYAKQRHIERKVIANLRHELAMEMMDRRETFETKRQKERIELLLAKYRKR